MAFRVDMDALDLSEEQDVSHRPYRDGFASCNAGMMHACGHDGHTAIGLGWRIPLNSSSPGLHGVIKLIFQPAEEGTRGARAMVDAGVVDDVDYFTAVHIGTGVPAGTVVCGSDNFMATTKFDAHFTGTRRSRRRKTRRRSTMPCWRQHKQLLHYMQSPRTAKALPE